MISDVIGMGSSLGKRQTIKNDSMSQEINVIIVYLLNS